jgi:hypothetical protein
MPLDRHPAGLTWVARDPLQRASHALAAEGRVWLIDPVDDAEALEAVARLGRVEAVVQLLDRHPRDCATLAGRLGVPHLELPEALPGTPFELFDVVALPVWRERALWWPELRTLVVPESVGTHLVWAAGPPAAGVHPFRRLLPPRGLRDRRPEHLLVGHGPALHGDDAAVALQAAVARSVRDVPYLATKVPEILRSGRSL